MGRLALLNWFLFMFSRPCVSNLAGDGRLRTETESVCVLHGNIEERRETLIGKKVENKTCRLPDVSVKAVSAAQVHSKVSEAYTCIRGSRQDPGPLCCWTPGILPPRTAVHLHMLHHVQAVPLHVVCCQIVFTVKQECRAESLLWLSQTKESNKSE